MREDNMSNLPKKPLQNVLEERQIKIESGISTGSPKSVSSKQQPNNNARSLEKRLAANRRNALKSTGPKTSDGKARSAQNALKHGMLSDSPVIPGLESQEAWEEHREGILESLKPVGYLETLFATRIATASWKMGRSVRYQAEVAESTVSATELDLAGRITNTDLFLPQETVNNRQTIENESKIVELLTTLPTLDDNLRLDKGVAALTMWALWKEVPDGPEEIVVPGVPRNDAAFEAFDNWTAGLLRKAVKVYARAAKMLPDQLREKCIGAGREKHDKAMEEERSWNLKLERERRIRVMLDPRRLDTLTRYETGCERSLFKNLHALERRQAARRGAVVSPPETIELDLTVQTADLKQRECIQELPTEPSTQDLPLNEVLDGAPDSDCEEKEKEKENCPTQNRFQDRSRVWSEECETNPFNCGDRSDSVQETEITNCETKPMGTNS
jgi:hypothetical protein